MLLFSHRNKHYTIQTTMSKHVKQFVTGHGINFETSRRNAIACQEASLKWSEIYSQLDIANNSVILFCGAKANGKSSLIRHIVNKLLFDTTASNNTTVNRQNCHGINSICYIDCDPGQAELTVPGLISAHIIASSDMPLKFPQYLNQHHHKKIACTSVGGTNMAVNPRLYIESCRFLLDEVKKYFNEHGPCPVVVNTCGYVRNVGLTMLIDLIKIYQPTDVVALNISNDSLRSIYADLSCKAIQKSPASFFYEASPDRVNGLPVPVLKYNYFVHDLNFSFVVTSTMPAKNRVAQQLAHFATIPECLYKPVISLEKKILDLNKISIFCVSSYPLKASIIFDMLQLSWINLTSLRKNVSIRKCGLKDEIDEDINAQVVSEASGENKVQSPPVIEISSDDDDDDDDRIEVEMEIQEAEKEEVIESLNLVDDNESFYSYDSDIVAESEKLDGQSGKNKTQCTSNILEGKRADLACEMETNDSVKDNSLKVPSTKKTERSVINLGDLNFNIVDEIGPNDCYGCGIVTNIDLKGRTLSLVTPLSQEFIDAHVNCIIRPLSLLVPRQLLDNNN